MDRDFLSKPSIFSRSPVRLISLAGDAQAQAMTELLRMSHAFGTGCEWVSVTGQGERKDQLRDELRSILLGIQSETLAVLLILSVETRADSIQALAVLETLAPLFDTGRIEVVAQLSPEWKMLEARLRQMGCFETLTMSIEDPSEWAENEAPLEAAVIQGIERLCDRQALELAKNSPYGVQVACFLLADWSLRAEVDPKLMSALRERIGQRLD